MDRLIPLIQESLSQNQEVSFRVKGTSMSPFFLDDCTEVTVAPSNGELKKFEVYLFQINQTYLLHRLIKKQPHKNIFQGDALYQFEVVDESNVIGIVKKMKTNNKETLSSNIWYKAHVRIHHRIKTIKVFFRRLIKG